MRRWIAAMAAIFNILNGLAMLFASSQWWTNVPGASETGPFNLHLVQDVGMAFLVAGLTLAMRAWRVAYWPAAVAGCAFLVGHALIHTGMIFTGHSDHALPDFAGIIIPAALALYSAFPEKGEHRHA